MARKKTEDPAMLPEEVVTTAPEDLELLESGEAAGEIPEPCVQEKEAQAEVAASSGEAVPEMPSDGISIEDDAGEPPQPETEEADFQAEETPEPFFIGIPPAEAAEPAESAEEPPPIPEAEEPFEGFLDPGEGGQDTDAEKVPPASQLPAPRERKPASFMQLNLRELDRSLSPEQRREWEAIYASYRSKSVLSGVVAGTETHSFTATNRETGEQERRKVLSLVVIGYRVKILIPQSEVTLGDTELPDFVLKHMVLAGIEFVITHIDRESDCAIASRRMALVKRRRQFEAQQSGGRAPELVPCNILCVGPARCLVECGGYDLQLRPADLSWSAIPDLRAKYHPGQKLEAKVLSFSAPQHRLKISVKEVNPFDGADQRHPVGCQRQAVISGKYKGGVYCTLVDSTVCLCLYSSSHFDYDFQPGDNVIVYIQKYHYDRKLIFGRIMAKL